MFEPFPPVPAPGTQQSFVLQFRLWRGLYLCRMPSLTTVNSCPRALFKTLWCVISEESVWTGGCGFFTVPFTCPFLHICKLATLVSCAGMQVRSLSDVSLLRPVRFSGYLQGVTWTVSMRVVRLTSQCTFYVWRSTDVFYIPMMGWQPTVYMFLGLSLVLRAAFML